MNINDTTYHKFFGPKKVENEDTSIPIDQNILQIYDYVKNKVKKNKHENSFTSSILLDNINDLSIGRRVSLGYLGGRNTWILRYKKA